MRRFRILAAGVLLASAAAAGCGTTLGDAVPVVDARTDATSYTAGAQITVRVRNPTRDAVFFAQCENRLSFTVQSRTGSTWIDAGTVDGTECSGTHSTRALQPGERYERTFSLAQAGTYRLRFLTGRLATSVGQEIIYSNTFTVQ